MEPPLSKDRKMVLFQGYYEHSKNAKSINLDLLNIPGRHFDSRGVMLDKDGYICISAYILRVNDLFKTSLGLGKNYFRNREPKVIDIITNW